jgi:hypothetical protein
VRRQGLASVSVLHLSREPEPNTPPPWPLHLDDAILFSFLPHEAEPLAYTAKEKGLRGGCGRISREGTSQYPMVQNIFNYKLQGSKSIQAEPLYGLRGIVSGCTFCKQQLSKICYISGQAHSLT